MRALVITLSLAMIVALLVGTLVVFGGVRVNPTLLTLLGGGLFMVAVLFACISAIGPKYRPTPALTPIMASAAALAATFVLVANLQLSSGQASAFRTSPPQPETSEPVPQARSVEPDEVPAELSLPEPPDDAFVAIPPPDDVPMDAPPIADEPPATAALQSEPTPMTAPTVPGATTVPIPVPRPRSPSETPQMLAPGETLTLSNDPFDASTRPPVRTVTPGAAAPTQAAPRGVTPPLPRTRPCGAGGPPCP